jgi:hypothetical protein
MSRTFDKTWVCGCLLLVATVAVRADELARPAIRLQRIDTEGTQAVFTAESAKVVKLPASQAHAKDRDTTFEVVGLDTSVLAALGEETLDQMAAARLLQVFVAAVDSGAASDSPSLLGTYRRRGDALCFQPRFPLEPGVTYEARLTLGNAAKPTARLSARFEVPRRTQTPTTRVERVYPTSNVLPENQLKFYLHFSAPMSAGRAYQHVRLLDASGKMIEGAFLEIGEELWDRSGQRFTLFFDPGRIKRGLKPREDLGPALEEGKSYTLLVDRQWQDANGNPLVAEFRKSFKVVEPDDVPPIETNWRIERPTSQNGFVLTIDFPEPLDHALLERVMWVERGSNPRTAEHVDGQIAISRQETRWQFTFAQPPMSDAAYFLVVERILEDRAGNHLGRKFEIDVFDSIDKQPSNERVRIPLSGEQDQ